MSSVTGHITNHTHLKVYRSFIAGLEPGVYQPSNVLIQTVNIDLVITNQTNAFKLVRTKGNLWAVTVNTRVDKLKPLKTTLTKVLNALKATEAKPEIIEDVRSHINSIKGIRATPKLKMDPADPEAPSDQSLKQISAAQTDIDHVIEEFSGLIDLLSLEPLYVPAETSITVAALNTLLSEIIAANDAVVNAFPAIDNARILRNKLLYAEGGGNELASKIRKYMLSISGANSRQYKQFTKVKFTKPKLYL